MPGAQDTGTILTLSWGVPALGLRKKRWLHDGGTDTGRASKTRNGIQATAR